MQEYGKCGEYLIQHRGNSILRMAGVNDIAGWAPRQAEPVQHHQLPDGVLEAWSPGQAKPDIFILETATDPDARMPSQTLVDVARFIDEVEHNPVLDRLAELVGMNTTAEDIQAGRLVLLQQGRADESGRGDRGLFPALPGS